MTKKDVERILKSPLSWLIGGIGSVATVVLYLAGDPTGLVAAVIVLIWSMSSQIFGGLSILAFTIAPNVSWVPVQPLSALAVGFGIVAVLRILYKVWRRLKGRVEE